MPNADRSGRRAAGGDVIAGLTLWAVFAAQAIAYARLARATAVAGLVTAIAGALVYAALGSSRRTSIGPAGAIAAIVGAALAKVPPEHVAASMAALTLSSAAVLFVAGLARIAFLQRLFPVPVFVGYLAGTGVSIVIGQAKDLVGHGHLALAVGLASMASVLALKRLAPRVPGPFAVLAAATVLSVVFRLQRHGVPVIGGTLGHFGSFAWPFGLGWAGWRPMIAPALSLALLVYVDALANADALAKKGDPPVRPVREYFALGAVNLVSGSFGGFVAGCSSSRSIVGIRSGARTQRAAAIAGVLLVLTALSVVRFLEPMPLAALAGVVLIAALDLVDVKRLREFWALRRADFVIALAAAAGVLFLGPVAGAGLGVLLALAEAFRRAMQPRRSIVAPDVHDGRIYEPFRPDALHVTSGIVVYRFGAPLFFGNADAFLEDMRELARAAPDDLRTVVINADGLGVPDATARDALLKSQESLRARGIELVFANARAVLREALAKIGTFSTVDEAEFVDDLKKVRRAGHERHA